MSFLSKNTVIWYDGALIPEHHANISVMSHGLHYGSGVFEGVRAYSTKSGSAIFRLEAHTKRLFNSAKLMNLLMPFDYETLLHAQKEVLLKNKLLAAYIRPIVFYGDASLGVYPKNLQDVHVAIAAWSWDNYFTASTASTASTANSVKVKTSTFRRHSVNSVLTKAKATGYYTNSLLALQEAKNAGYHEAILMDLEGFIAEGSSSNVFIVKDKILYTPTDANILPGITRDTIFHLARDLNIPVVEKNLTRNELYLADEMFLVGTAVELMPVIQVDHIKIGSGVIGPISTCLKSSFHQVLHGNNIKYQHWMTDINDQPNVSSNPLKAFKKTEEMSSSV
ncbi:MAG: branched-chain amino acid transaminase [Endozoicomonadaceae bacterium]|nr:branched-chain amino acid transaminase [Endozoicomonadaceae bacterium]